jgi:hypothetical protein
MSVSTPNASEADAYTVQLAALERLRASDADSGAIRQAMRAAKQTREVRRH